MKEKAIAYCKDGVGCAGAILLAARDCFGIQIGEELLGGSKAISPGFGVGGICSALVACVLVLGMLFDTETAKRLRTVFLFRFHEKKGSLNCYALSADREDCSGMIGEAAALLEEIVRQEQARNA